MNFSKLLPLLMMAAVSPVVAHERPIVAVSIPPQQWVVERLVGGLVDIHVLLPPGSSPATFDPSPRQITALSEALVFLSIGAPFERAVVPKIAEVLPDLKIVDTAVGIDRRAMTPGGTHRHHSLDDPHIWLDPHRMKAVAITTANTLKTVLPAHRQLIGSSLIALNSELDAVDQKIVAILRQHVGREILVFHPAYGYFTDRYQLEQVPIEVEGKSPTARQLAAIIHRFGGRPASAVFVQPQFSAATAQRVADSLGCRVVELDPLASDYSTNLEIMATRIAAEIGD